MRLAAMLMVFLLGACHGGRSEEDAESDLGTPEADAGGIDAPDEDDGAASDAPVDMPVDGDGPGDPVVDIYEDGFAGCDPEACNEFCDSIGRGPGECRDEACWCMGTTDAEVDPDAPPDMADDRECRSDGDCNDSNPCTQDLCAPATHTCVYYPLDGMSCDDGLFCNGIETCVGDVCTPGEMPCHVTEPICQIVTCDEATDECILENAPEGTDCDDGRFCNGPDVCDGTGDCVHGPVPCPMASEDPCMYPVCNETDDVCEEEPKPDGMSCNDEYVCNGEEVCIGGICEPGEDPCDDGDPCTDDICHEGPEPECEHIPVC